jgi:hypothetical protein
MASGSSVGVRPGPLLVPLLGSLLGSLSLGKFDGFQEGGVEGEAGVTPGGY